MGYTANALDISAPGGLTYITSASSREIDVLSSCNQAQTQTLPANAPTLIAKLPNGTVVYDQTFNVAYSNATVQSAITTAAVDLTNAGAASYTGPAQTGHLAIPGPVVTSSL